MVELSELFRLKRARHRLGKRQKFSALQTKQLIGLSGHRPIQPRLQDWRRFTSHEGESTLQQLTNFTPQDN
jgi:hypothetical protein